MQSRSASSRQTSANPIDNWSPPRVAAAALPALLLAACALISGCGRSPRERLLGKWIGSRVDRASTEQAELAAPWVKATTWEFAGDKLTVSLPSEPPRSGTFRIARVDGPNVKLAITRPDGQTTDEATVRFEGDRTMRWNIGEQREVVFVRVTD